MEGGRAIYSSGERGDETIGGERGKDLEEGRRRERQGGMTEGFGGWESE